MFIEIKYKALHWDNHQGGSGNPFDGRLLRVISDDKTMIETYDYVLGELKKEAEEKRNVMGNYHLVSIIIDSFHCA